jgi:alpha-1,3-glucosyltransferase
MAPPASSTTSLAMALWMGAAVVVVLRVLVGYQPHSGQDNYHGGSAHDGGGGGAYGGDFEAQRHWMELTWHLPIGQWYYYDLQYWGLDYPPLTAYLSWLCGWGSHALVGPDSVALFTSRGYEDSVHKAYMRSTVIVTDVMFYGSAAWMWTTQYHRRLSSSRSESSRWWWTYLLLMVQPSILLIDHGHFQYNTTALGLSLWSFYFLTKKANFDRNCTIGSVLFVCALSFKQMTLYYSTAVFFYLLGRCFQTSSSLFESMRRIAILGATVPSTFVALWWPFVLFGPNDTNSLDRLLHIVRRIFPLQRGLFEGKVSNLWCVLSVKPIRIRDRIPVDLQPVCALGLTLLLLTPSSIQMFRATGYFKGTSSNLLLWGTTSSALAFFLASFQVHEKSLLLALAPCSLLDDADETFVHWFAIVTTFTLFPLMQIDRLQTAYVCTILIYLAVLGLRKELSPISPSSRAVGFFEQNALFQLIPNLSYAVMLVLHIAELVVPVPETLPDLFPVLWSIVGCGFCCIAYIGTCWHMFQPQTIPSSLSSKQKLT